MSFKGYTSVRTFDSTNERTYSLGNRQPESQDSLRSRRFQLVKKKIAGTVALCVFGVVLTIVGLYWMIIDRAGYVPFLIIGLLCLVPGSYGAYEIAGTLKGWSGFEQVPDTEQLLDEMEDAGEDWMQL